jgi:uncharacterized protein YlxW (UPF0749 family)
VRLPGRPRRSDALAAVLLLALGFAAVVQVRSADEEPLDTARQEDLVQILDELANRDDRLRAEVAALEQTRRELTAGGDRTGAALDEARRRAQLLGVLAGTVPAEGPGVLLTITDPDERIGPDVLLDALQELRAAGAEAVQLEGPVDLAASSDDPVGERVRVVTSTELVEGAEGGVEVDGTPLFPPYRFVVVGDPGTLSSALAIPGGVVDNVEQRGGTALVEEREAVRVGALRPLETPRYARPAPGSGD